MEEALHACKNKIRKLEVEVDQLHTQFHSGAQRHKMMTLRVAVLEDAIRAAVAGYRSETEPHEFAGRMRDLEQILCGPTEAAEAVKS